MELQHNVFTTETQKHEAVILCDSVPPAKRVVNKSASIKASTRLRTPRVFGQIP
jgi:hypothetical protein